MATKFISVTEFGAKFDMYDIFFYNFTYWSEKVWMDVELNWSYFEI